MLHFQAPIGALDLSLEQQVASSGPPSTIADFSTDITQVISDSDATASLNHDATTAAQLATAAGLAKYWQQLAQAAYLQSYHKHMVSQVRYADGNMFSC